MKIKERINRLGFRQRGREEFAQALDVWVSSFKDETEGQSFQCVSKAALLEGIPQSRGDLELRYSRETRLDVTPGWDWRTC